jgi:L-rhamnose mutarotase
VRRICFTLQVKPDRLEEYRRRHAHVWPEMLKALRDTGWHEYSLFLRDDGLLVGYLRTSDFDATLKAMDATDVNARWQAQMADFFESGRPDQHMHMLTEVFNLDDQLETSND